LTIQTAEQCLYSLAVPVLGLVLALAHELERAQAQERVRELLPAPVVKRVLDQMAQWLARPYNPQSAPAVK